MAEEELKTMAEKGTATVDQLEEAREAIEQGKQEEGEETKNEEESEPAPYFAPTKVGRIQDVLQGLLSLADDLLKVDGRLVFLFPVDRYQ